MTTTPPMIGDRFSGCLLGLAIGDAVGAQYEGQSAEYLAKRFGSVEALLENIPPNGLYYTDDTQMAIGVAETLIACGTILKGRRHYVHLSTHQATMMQVAMRHGKPVLLVIQSQQMHLAGHEFFLTGNHVWLTEHVPPPFISVSTE